jgi:hypothetical protein
MYVRLPMNATELLNCARRVLTERGTKPDIDEAEAFGMTFDGHVVVLFVEGGDTFAPWDNALEVGDATDMEEGLRQRLFGGSEPLFLGPFPACPA